MRRVAKIGLAAAVVLMAVGQIAAAQQTSTEHDDDSGPLTIFFVRHGEAAGDVDSRVPLAARGLARAYDLVRVLERIELTHAFSSHTLRSRQTVAPAAESHGLVVTPLPPLGSEVGGVVIDGVSPSRLAIAPLAEALRALPPRSSALVGVNASNLFGILNRLGVPLATASEPCQLGATCVPCLDGSCFPREFDNLWVLIIPDTGEDPTLLWLKY